MTETLKALPEYARISILGDLETLDPEANHIISKDNTIIINPTEEQYLECGWKHLVYDEQPELNPGESISEYYEQDETHIYVRYRIETPEEHEIPVEP